EVVEERCGYLEARHVDAFHDFEEELPDAVHVEAVEVDAFPAGKGASLLGRQLVGDLRTVDAEQVIAHPFRLVVDGLRPLERLVRVVVVVDRRLREAVNRGGELLVPLQAYGHRTYSRLARADTAHGAGSRGRMESVRADCVVRANAAMRLCQTVG